MAEKHTTQWRDAKRERSEKLAEEACAKARAELAAVNAPELEEPAPCVDHDYQPSKNFAASLICTHCNAMVAKPVEPSEPDPDAVPLSQYVDFD